MQSFLQYKRFRDAAVKQLERDRVKLRNLQQEGREDREQEWVTTESSDDSKTDLEKNGSGQEEQPADDSLSRGVHAGDAGPSTDPSLPQEEDGSMQRDQRPRNFREEAEEATPYNSYPCEQDQCSRGVLCNRSDPEVIPS